MLFLFANFEKTLDFLKWNFTIKSLGKFNFVKWIHSFYKNFSRCIINNGHIMPIFPSRMRGEIK